MSKASQLVETQAFAERLHLSPDELRYGTLTSIFKAQDSGADIGHARPQDACALHDAVAGRVQDGV